MKSLAGKVAVVTGGETGIGAAIAEAFAEAGAQVFIGGLLEDEGRATAGRAAARGARVVFTRTDVRDVAEVEALMNATEEAGGLDILVNNAGVFDGFAACLETSDALWDQVIAINLKGCFLGCRAALRRMVPRQRGRIINIASVGGLRGGADGLSYTASKFGVIGLTRQAACTYADRGITINAICPGVIQTEIREHSATILAEAAPPMGGIGADPEGYRRYVPAARRGQPAEVAALAVFLASDAAAYITGQALAVDGGWTAT